MGNDTPDSKDPREQMPEEYVNMVKTILIPYNLSEKGITTVMGTCAFLYNAGKLAGQVEGLEDASMQH
tara:strand:+ start:76 stop:279 length:204 start_codon:yes stop_codon:yes gene_type:complete